MISVATNPPTLSVGHPSALEYHRRRFDRDLSSVITGRHSRHERLSVSSFCPDFPDVPMYAEPARAFQALPDSCWFLCSLFAAQLRDQATHFVTGRVTKRRADSVGEIVLVGLLSSYWNVVEPTLLLLVLSLYRLPKPTQEVAEAISDIVTAEFQEVQVETGAATDIFGAAHTALMRTPDSLRAFVPNGDSYKWPVHRDTVRLFSHYASDALKRAAV